MRFNDFFAEYKIGLKQENIPNMWLKPLYRKILLSLLILNFIFLVPLLIKQSWLKIGIIMLIITVLFIIFSMLDSSKKNMQQKFEEYSSVRSNQRIKFLILLLKKYGINPSDKNKIELLIQQAAEEKEKRDPLLYVKQPLKTLWALIISILAFTATQLAKSVTIEIILTLAFIAIIIVLSSTAVSLALTPIYKDTMYSDSCKYDGLIYDLKQLILFDSNLT